MLFVYCFVVVKCGEVLAVRRGSFLGAPVIVVKENIRMPEKCIRDMFNGIAAVTVPGTFTFIGESDEYRWDNDNARILFFESHKPGVFECFFQEVQWIPVAEIDESREDLCITLKAWKNRSKLVPHEELVLV